MKENILQTQSVIESEPKPARPWLKIGLISFLGVFLASGLVFAGYKLGQRRVAPIVTPPTPIPTIVTPTSVFVLSPTPIPIATIVATPTSTMATPTPDPTADWKTYTNTKYGYEIKYPPGTKTGEGPGYEERIQETSLTFFGPRYPGPGEFTDGFGITLAVIKNPSQKTPMQFAQENYNGAKEDINNRILEGDISKCKVESAIRSNTTGARFTYCTQAPGSGVLNLSEWYVKNGITYQIYAVLQNEDYLTTFNLILSTFRFLPSTNSGQGE